MFKIFRPKVLQIVVFFLTILFVMSPFNSLLSAQPVNGPVIDGDLQVPPDPRDRFREIVSRFSISFRHTGFVEHEHEFTFPSGNTAFNALGVGLVRGNQVAQSKETLNQAKINSRESYEAYTDLNAVIGQYMRIINTMKVTNAHSARAGVEPKPGQTGQVKQSIASNLDEKGEYTIYDSSTQVSDGVTRRTSEVGGASSTINVQGSSKVYEKVVVDSGGTRTGWWDMD